MAQFGSKRTEEERAHSFAWARRFGLQTPLAARVFVVLFAAVSVFVGAPFLLERLNGSAIGIQRADDGVFAEGSTVQMADTGGQSQEASEEDQPESQTSEALKIIVHIDGAVAAPGVYVVESTDPRVNDSVVLAGGLAEGADTALVNLAAPLSDGMKVHIPWQGEAAEALVPAGDTTPLATQEPAQPTQPGLVNLNTASASELESLPGIGPSLAAAIIEERNAGAFQSIDDLLRVSGIGEKKLEKLRSHACV